MKLLDIQILHRMTHDALKFHLAPSTGQSLKMLSPLPLRSASATLYSCDTLANGSMLMHYAIIVIVVNIMLALLASM